MKIVNVIVNWSFYDEELLEPYEWDKNDDLELLEDVEMIYVDDKLLNHCINDIVLFRTDLSQKVIVFFSERYSVCVEIDKNNMLKYRSMLTYDKRNELDSIKNNYKLSHIDYKVVEYCQWKEYGLTRYERNKKQFIVDIIELMYLHHDQRLVALYKTTFQLNHDDMEYVYEYFMRHIGNGYNYIHDYLFKELYLV